MKIFEEMLDETVIEKFLNHRQSQQKYNVDTDDFIKLKNYIKSPDYKNDVNRLIKGDYYISIPKKILIKKINSNKKRNCFIYKENEIFLFKLMTYVLMRYDYLYEDSIYSFRKYISHRNFFKKLKKIDNHRDLYVLKIDLKKYGESVDQDILLEKLKNLFINDIEFYNFIHWLLKRNKYTQNGIIKHERISIIPGTPIGSFFNNIYLTDLDTYIKKNSKLYMRYNDDMAIFLDSYDKVCKIKRIIEQKLEKLKLEINPDKTNIYKPSESFSILGIEVSKDGYDIAKESLNKIIFKLNHRLNRLLVLYRKKIIDSKKAISLYFNFTTRYFYGDYNKENEINWTAWAFGIINKINSLKFLDNFVQNCLRTIISKKKSNKKFNIKYNTLKELGYKSLVHSYYHNYKK